MKRNTTANLTDSEIKQIEKDFKQLSRDAQKIEE